MVYLKNTPPTHRHGNNVCYRIASLVARKLVFGSQEVVLRNMNTKIQEIEYADLKELDKSSYLLLDIRVDTMRI